MTEKPATRTHRVFDDLITTLGEIREGYLQDSKRLDNPLDVVEGYRYIGQLLSTASELFFEADPERPRFASIVSAARKIQGDNPDAIYQYARIRGDRSYRVRGTIGSECYTSFSLHARAADGGLAGLLVGDISDKDLEIGEDGQYEIILSATKHEGNWLKLPSNVHAVLVRSYYQLEISAQNNSNIAVRIEIECLDDVGRPEPLSDAVFAERMAEGVAFLRQATLGQALPDAPSPVPFVSDVPNDVATPYSFRDSGLPVPGAADIVYSMGKWDLAPDEALVMTGRLPEGLFANVMLWNRHMQTLDYRNLTSSLNGAQLKLEADGRYRIVISAEDPGVANWLNTDGHKRGSIFWRFLLPESDPPKPECVVMPVCEVT